MPLNLDGVGVAEEATGAAEGTGGDGVTAELAAAAPDATELVTCVPVVAPRGGTGVAVVLPQPVASANEARNIGQARGTNEPITAF